MNEIFMLFIVAITYNLSKRGALAPWPSLNPPLDKYLRPVKEQCKVSYVAT